MPSFKSAYLVRGTDPTCRRRVVGSGRLLARDCQQYTLRQYQLWRRQIASHDLGRAGTGRLEMLRDIGLRIREIPEREAKPAVPQQGITACMVRQYRSAPGARAGSRLGRSACWDRTSRRAMGRGDLRWPGAGRCAAVSRGRRCGAALLGSAAPQPTLLPGEERKRRGSGSEIELWRDAGKRGCAFVFACACEKGGGRKGGGREGEGRKGVRREGGGREKRDGQCRLLM
eukprot:856409-Rhodomonas_salina.1